MTNDQELDQVVKDAATHGVEKAYKDVPPLRLKWWQRVALVVAGILIIGNSTFNGIFVKTLNHQAACLNSVNVNSRKIAQDDRRAVDQVIGSVAKAKSRADVQQAFADYQAARKANDAARAKENSKDCTK